jgi:hypothetical protein
MTTADLPFPRARPRVSLDLLARVAPTLLAGALAAAYVIISPPSLDLAAHLFRAQLFRVEGFGIWNNWWYSGHDIVGYSVLFPAVSAWLTPQLAGAIAATASATLFELLAHRHFGRDARLGALVFGAATATNLYTGRLAFAFGTLPALGAILALDMRRNKLACLLASLSALCSPVAALFAAIVASAYAVGGYLREHRVRAAVPPSAVVIAALGPVGLIAIAFPEGGSEPFGLPTMLPIMVLTGIALVAVPKQMVTLRVGIAIYGLVTIGCYLVPSPIGSNIARLATFIGAPLAVLVWRHRPLILALVALPFMYLAWQAPVRDLTGASNDQSTSTSYYRPLVQFLGRQKGPPFRTEIPFTRFHWETYVVAIHFPLARGWERQLDIKDNSIFYGAKLTATSYEQWLHANAVRFVAAPDTELDYSARAEMALIDRGLPYLRLVMRSRHWRVFEVSDATPIVQGPGTLTKLGPDYLTIRVQRPGTFLVHVRFTPYWALSGGSGCVASAGQYTRLTVREPGIVKLVTSFAPDRIAASSPRCT